MKTKFILQGQRDDRMCCCEQKQSTSEFMIRGVEELSYCK